MLLIKILSQFEIAKPFYVQMGASSEASNSQVPDCNSPVNGSNVAGGVSTTTSPLVDTERHLAVLLGSICASHARSTALSADERDCQRWLQADFFQGGLQLLTPQNPYEEEKGESRTQPSSCTTTPGQLASHSSLNSSLSVYSNDSTWYKGHIVNVTEITSCLGTFCYRKFSLASEGDECAGYRSAGSGLSLLKHSFQYRHFLQVLPLQ